MAEIASNPFEVLGVPARFDLDEQELHRRYLAASAATHPDRFVDPMEQADAAERAAAINAAYRTLADPAGRARALLALRGDTGEADGGELPADLLMEILEAREELEEAVTEEDQATIDRLRRWAAEQRAAALAAVGEQFANDAVDAAAVRGLLNAVRYYDRMLV